MEKKRIYFAAPLFHFADKYFNISLVEHLQEWFDVILPQRTGFESSKLHEALKEGGKVEEWEIENVRNHLIYYLDVGFLLPSCDFCVGRLDEPVDEGVVAEIGHSRKMRIPVIGYRTDCRTPYGTSSNEVRGSHFFPAYDCDMFINFLTDKIEDIAEGKAEMGRLAKLIHKGSEKIIKDYHGNLPHKNINTTSGIHYIGKELFSGIEDLHSKEYLEKVVRKYQFLEKAFGKMICTEIVRA